MYPSTWEVKLRLNHIFVSEISKNPSFCRLFCKCVFSSYCIFNIDTVCMAIYGYVLLFADLRTLPKSLPLNSTVDFPVMTFSLLSSFLGNPFLVLLVYANLLKERTGLMDR